jgi:hypothetical protein
MDARGFREVRRFPGLGVGKTRSGKRRSTLERAGHLDEIGVLVSRFRIGAFGLVQDKLGVNDG